MIWNVIDRRHRPYRWAHINAIVEAVEHDNTCVDADIAGEALVSLVIDHDRIDSVSIQAAIRWANAQRCPVTLYLYDGDGDTTAEHCEAVSLARFPNDSINS